MNPSYSLEQTYFPGQWYPMNQTYPFEALSLPFDFTALMPRWDANTLYFHHGIYYKQAIRTLNALVEKHRLTHLNLADLISADLNLPVTQERQVKSAAGAAFNHHLFFDGLTDAVTIPPHSRLTMQIQAVYGSMRQFQTLMTEAAQSLDASGWVWLASSGNGNLHIIITKNNEVINLETDYPILVVDLWEHAYLPMEHFNIQKYIATWFTMIDWRKADRRYLEAQKFFDRRDT